MGAPVRRGRANYPLLFVLAVASGGVSAAFDPTAPPAAPATAAGAQGTDSGLAWVRVNGRHSIAWYGGTTVRLGDSVEGGRVSAIAEDHIVISGKDGLRTIYLLDRAIRKPRGR